MSEETLFAEKKNRKFAPKHPYTAYTALTLDENYRVLTYGKAAGCLFGFPEVSMLGKHVSALLPELACGSEKAPDQQSTPLQFKNVPMKAVHADGKTFPVMVGLRQDYLQGSCRHLVLVRNLAGRQQA
ncbi:MAG: hypothetical protein HXY24_16360 [Rubrivivax sp.]|nr:hypothetical protein [Rubrivivax sp.]